MIHVRRARQDRPSVLDGREAEIERADAAERHAHRSHEFDRFSFRVYRHPEVREQLRLLFNDKCAYCESAVGTTNSFDIEHHRPRFGALNLDGTVAQDHYWWLASEWTNLVPSCMYCNRSKGPRFPVRGVRANPGTIGTALAAERPLLLDPCVDEPTDHLVFLEDGLIAPKTDRGEITIDVVALNRRTLVEARNEAVHALRSELLVVAASEVSAEMANAVRRAMAPDKPYAAIRRQFAREWFEGQAGELGLRAGQIAADIAGDAPLVTKDDQEQAVERGSRRAERKRTYSVEAEDREDKEAFFAGKKFIEWIRIEDFKAIDRLSLTFPPPKTEREPWLALVGENGAGKSSVLQAVALALMGQRHANDLGLDASTFVRRDARRSWGRVLVKLATIPDPIEVRFRRSSDKFMCRTPDPKVLLLGYGATRLLRPRQLEAEEVPPHVRIKNLFQPAAPLSDVESWLLDTRAVDSKRFRAVTDALKDLLMLGGKDDFARDEGHVYAILRGECPVLLQQLSDGFQSVVALVCDVMKSLLERFHEMQEAEGIVLVDELVVCLAIN